MWGRCFSMRGTKHCPFHFSSPWSPQVSLSCRSSSCQIPGLLDRTLEIISWAAGRQDESLGFSGLPLREALISPMNTPPGLSCYQLNSAARSNCSVLHMIPATHSLAAAAQGYSGSLGQAGWIRHFPISFTARGKPKGYDSESGVQSIDEL